MTRIHVELNKMTNSDKLEWNDFKNLKALHFMKGRLDVETKIYERFLKGMRLSGKNAQILEDFRKHMERQYELLHFMSSSKNSANSKIEDICIQSTSVKTDNDCLEGINDKPATGLCDRVCKSIMRAFYNSRAKFD